MYCSVKFLEPTVIVGPLPPPSSEPPVSPTLPQAASKVSASAASSAGMPRINFVLFFTIFLLCLYLPAALLRDLQTLGGHAPLQRAETEFRDDREDRHRERAREQDGGVVALGAFDYEVPQTTAADERRQSRARDHLYRRGADASEDHRRRHRELNTGEDLASREPHAACGVYDIPAHLSQTRRGVDEDRGYGQRGERDERRVEAEAEEGLAESQDRQRRDGASDVADVDRQG